MELAWGLKVSPAFRTRVFQICDDFGWDRRTHASWLMACMAFESAETFSPKILNAAGSGAVGLIQFMPSTARGLGTTTGALATLTAEEQLAYVKKYFLPYYERIASLSDMYMAILMPKHIGKAEDSVLFFNPNIAYRQNAGLDLDKDGKITKAECSSKVRLKLEKGFLTAHKIEIP